MFCKFIMEHKADIGFIAGGLFGGLLFGKEKPSPFCIVIGFSKKASSS